ncbi:DUF1942 domain-containing protein [Gordonia sp. CPCC 206044]|uniref:DUF1942 domain-containing protein n=1 Tax=Gordonia sp. CPCC 206044 TaxID=3140793 RepID=UPI003AF3BB4A
MKRVILTLVSVLALLASATVAHAAPRSVTSQLVAHNNWAGYVTLNSATLTSTTMTVTVTVEATKGEMPVNPLYFIAKTADGTTFDPTYVDGNTTLHSGDLPAGEKVRGAVAFAVHGARPSALIYEAPLGEQLAKWTITWRAVKPATKPAIPFGS